MSMHGPLLLNDAGASPEVLAATVIANGEFAGDVKQALLALLPAATMTVAPAPASRATAASITALKGVRG